MYGLSLHGVSFGLFLLGLAGIVLNRKNILVMLLAIELMLLGVNLNFLTFAVELDDRMGLLFALLVLTVAAAESAIGLALLVVYYRVRKSLDIEMLRLLRG
jgi:NADH-quinone oxidoreductase subunit K